MSAPLNGAFEITPESIEALARVGLVIVPRQPTKAMLEDEGTWAYELAQDAAGVWSSMVEIGAIKLR